MYVLNFYPLIPLKHFNFKLQFTGQSSFGTFPSPPSAWHIRVICDMSFLLQPNLNVPSTILFGPSPSHPFPSPSAGCYRPSSPPSLIFTTTLRLYFLIPTFFQPHFNFLLPLPAINFYQRSATPTRWVHPSLSLPSSLFNFNPSYSSTCDLFSFSICYFQSAKLFLSSVSIHLSSFSITYFLQKSIWIFSSVLFLFLSHLSYSFGKFHLYSAIPVFLKFEVFSNFYYMPIVHIANNNSFEFALFPSQSSISFILASGLSSDHFFAKWDLYMVLTFLLLVQHVLLFIIGPIAMHSNSRYGSLTQV